MAILIIPVLIATLSGVGAYLLMSRSLLRLVMGFLIFSQAINLFIFVSSGLERGKTPIISEHSSALIDGPDPLPQALILTAIVIGFAATAFLVVLARQTYLSFLSEDSDQMRSSE